MDPGESGRIFAGPTSVVIIGDDRPLLNWVAYALASQTDPEFIWTDVRLPGEVLHPSDVLTRGLIPENRMSIVWPGDLARNEPDANVAGSFLIRSDEPTVNIQRLVDFLRLPTHTQEILARPRPAGVTRVLILSNGHRVVALYPSPEAVALTVRAIVATDSILLMTFADAPPEGRLAFDTVVHVAGSESKRWREAKLRVEKGPPNGPLRQGLECRLEEFAPIAAVLAKELE